MPVPSGVVATTLNPQRLGGYDIFAKAGSAAVPGVDLPVARVASGANSATLAEPDLDLEPDSTCHVGVWPFNQSGHAEVGAELTFPVDGDGHPMQVPRPVTGLSARAVVGGLIEVRWHYDEPAGIAIAEDFSVGMDWLSPWPELIPEIPSIPHTPPKRDYVVRLESFPEGLWRVRVWARKAGKSIADVTGVVVRTDSTAPAQAVAGLSAD